MAKYGDRPHTAIVRGPLIVFMADKRKARLLRSTSNRGVGSANQSLPQNGFLRHLAKHYLLWGQEHILPAHISIHNELVNTHSLIPCILGLAEKQTMQNGR